MGILTWIVVGLIAGWLAGQLMKSGFGLVGDLIIGVVGALIGGFLASQLFHVADPISGINLETLLVAFLGSVLVIFVLRYFPRRLRL
jgi:uncharacterized membrane protein YeaQ/YmgE (transglycosylase-associated protein family)